MIPWLQELHSRYFEPLSEVAPSLQALLAGSPVKKLLFMTDPAVVDARLKPHWQVCKRQNRQIHALTWRFTAQAMCCLSQANPHN